MSINLDDRCLSIVYVTADPKTPSLDQWCFKAEQIKAITSGKRDERTAYLYVVQNSDDFLLVFPSQLHRNRYRNKLAKSLFKFSFSCFQIFRFVELTLKITKDLEGNQLLDDYQSLQNIEVWQKKKIF